MSMEAPTREPNAGVPGTQGDDACDRVADRAWNVRGIVRSTLVPAGKHVVSFSFDPPGLTLGSTLSARALELLRDVVVLELVAYLAWLVARSLIWLVPRARRAVSNRRRGITST